MHIVPVIDLKGGGVVHARRGDRDRYRPLVSTLCADAAPRAVVAALRARGPTPVLYVADLDAIAGGGDHAAQVADLLDAHRDLTVWLDSGLAPAYAAVSTALRARLRHVLGTESPAARARLAALDASDLRDAIVSLDFRGDVLLGMPEASVPAAGTVLALDLARVGSATGPDLALLQRLRHRYPACRLYAAGGVRDRADLDACARAGADGALIATAIHSGAIAGW